MQIPKIGIFGEEDLNESVPTGSIQRAKSVLDALAASPEGATLSRVIADTEFSKTTAHRTLQSLQGVDYVFQDPDTRRYFLGNALFRLSRNAGESSLSALSARSMHRIATETEDTVFLTIPEGAASICVRVETGAFPIRTLTLEPGDRTPLGVGANAQALYAVEQEAKRKAAGQANRAWMADYNYTPELAEDLASDFQVRGYALNPSIAIPGMSAIGLPIVTKSGSVVAAIGIGAINERMTTKRIEGVLMPVLRREVDQLSTRFSVLEEGGVL